MATVKYRVKAQSHTPARTAVETRGFTMIVDEPRNLGGTDQGPSPVEYVLGALTGCLNVVAHMVAGEMGFTLSELEFDVEGDLDPGKFMGKNTEERAGFKEIRVRMRVSADADDETLRHWREAVESRCPVGDNLRNPTPVTITLER